jgi:K319-like protein
MVLITHTNATLENNFINIISPTNNSQVPVGNLTITGTAAYSSSQPCTVYALWNDTQSIPRPVITISDEKNYSMWKFTYDSEYHEIIEGPNSLMAILSCLNLPNDNLTKLYSININGIEKSNTRQNLSNFSSEISDMVPNLKLNDPLEEGDVFSSKNFELAMPLTKSNETKSGSSNTDEFEKIYRTNINNTLLDNDTQIGPVPPSILEIESNQNSNEFLSISNETRLIADAGNDQTVSEGTSVVLNGSNSKSNQSVILSYVWKQMPNPNITIGGANTMIWSFIAPNVSTDTTLTFELVVTDDRGITSTDEVNIIVRDGNNTHRQTNLNDGILAEEEQNGKSNVELQPRNLIIQTLVDKNPVSKDEEQVIKIDLIDANSDDKINNATIRGQIMDPSKKVIKEFLANDDSIKLTLNIPKNANVGNFVVSVNASAPGYLSSGTDTNFKVQK